MGLVRACLRAEAGRSHGFGTLVDATMIIYLLTPSSPGGHLGVLRDASVCVLLLLSC